MHFSLCEGWTNPYIEKGKPYVFATLEDALNDLQEDFEDWAAEIAAGERGEDEGYDITEFKIKCNESGKVYDLALNDHAMMNLPTKLSIDIF